MARPGWPTTRRLTFEVWHDTRNIGRHALEFRGDDQDFTVAIEARFVVKLGPVPLFQYQHLATEIWRAGRFAELRSQTVTNGAREQVTAIRSANGVVITTLDGKRRIVAAAALPLTHWNQQALLQPLFNPQTGAPIRAVVSRQAGESARLADARVVPATRYALTGETEIVEWYDSEGVWAALRGKIKDGSYIDYRRSA